MSDYVVYDKWKDHEPGEMPCNHDERVVVILAAGTEVCGMAFDFDWSDAPLADELIAFWRMA
jgi:hypothetical protein